MDTPTDDARALLVRLWSWGVALTLQGDGSITASPAGSLSDAVKAEIVALKADIAVLLASSEVVAP